MALNRFMHPRNIYKTPPNFEKLNHSYKEFSTVAKMDAKGKVTIDFKDPQSLRVLTKCLLKADFNLDVEIPEDRLVPTLPLRLNYVLWIEDLMVAIRRNSDVRGIDIGTGACAIYPLLAAVRNKWLMIGTEMDAVSLKVAQENVERNNLQGLIQIKRNDGPILLENIFNEDKLEVFDFCMCNPPFYSNLQELCESRSPARLPPKNGFTGSIHELITEGGELEFCRKLINESKNCPSKVKLFTTMIGHKYNLSELLQDLKAENIKHTHTEFCQGRVTRWGLAWTFQDHDIHKLVPPREKLRKKNVPVLLELPKIPNCEGFENCCNKLKQMFNDLKINFRILNKSGYHVILDVLAYNNTWSNQRRKKRQLKRMEETSTKKSKQYDSNEKKISDSVFESPKTVYKKNNNNTSTTENLVTVESDITPKSSEFIVMQGSGNIVKPDHNNISVSSSENCYKSPEEIDPLVHTFIKVCKKENSVTLESEFVDGTGGKECLHQIIQYIKNNWK